jgi:hypothetical protein
MPSQTKKILAILGLTLIAAIGLFSLGIAYAGGVRGIGLLGVWFFLTFGIVIVLAQLIRQASFFPPSLERLSLLSERKRCPSSDLG